MTALLNNRYAIVTALAVVVAILPFTFPSSYYLRVASLVWVSAFAAIGLNVLMGKAGQGSLGHADGPGLSRPARQRSRSAGGWHRRSPAEVAGIRHRCRLRVDRRLVARNDERLRQSRFGRLPAFGRTGDYGGPRGARLHRG